MLVAATVSAQSVNYEKRYELLVSQVGPGGIGVETLLDKWQAVDSTNHKMLSARFDYYLAKSQSEQVIKKSQKKYLGMEPLLSLKDSTGAPVYYFREMLYDDELFAKALKTADRLASLYPDDLERMMPQESIDAGVALLYTEKDALDDVANAVKTLVERGLSVKAVPADSKIQPGVTTYALTENGLKEVAPNA
jgi:hypothetical protein